jgi:hypothetical protein
MLPRKHVVITGTGRAGTTFLVKLLTDLGLETGFSVDNMESVMSQIARAGLEYDLRQENSPFIIKDPSFCDYAAEVMRRDDIIIEHVVIPIRDLREAAESRRYVEKLRVSRWSFIKRLKHKFSPRVIAGGLWHTHSQKPGKQEEALLGKIYQLLLAIAEKNVPVTFMLFPKIVLDCPYLFDKLQPILQGITYESFSAVFDRQVHPELVHYFNNNM